MNALETLALLENLKELAARMEPALQERAVKEAVDGGAAVAVRPWSFRHPFKGESDPWFGLAYHQWLALRNEGFRGFFTAGETGSPRAALFIIYDQAAAFLAARAERQAEQLAGRSEGTEHLRQARAKRGRRAA